MQHISDAWKTVKELACRGVLFRLPNRLWLIRAIQRLKVLFRSQRANRDDRIALFNPEHLYIFGNGYLRERLKECGFDHIVFLSSRCPARNGILRAISDLFFRIAWMVYIGSFKRIILTPSQLIIAEKQKEHG